MNYKKYMKYQSYFNKNKRALAIRMRGVGSLLVGGKVKGRCVLDAGCAEGRIALKFWKAGASLVHGVDIRNNAIRAAQNLIPKNAAIKFWTNNIETMAEEHMLPKYDIILFLGLYHHLPKKIRDKVLCWLVGKCEVYFLIRTNEKYPRSWIFKDFNLIRQVKAVPGVAKLDIYERVHKEVNIR
jgi:2-polyprenyl-3-methyl-5-hydroxy-6-metoxy-1,4-benzoquinol methylase